MRPPTITEHEQAIAEADLMEKPPRKPVAWQLEDAHLFNETVCSTLQVPHFPTATGGFTEGDLANALGIFTDGSARGRRYGKHQASCAGWGFAVYRATSPRDQGELMVEACGPEATTPQDPRYLGACSITTNTGELSAIVEALLWLLGQRGSSEPTAQDGGLIQVVTDSTYVQGLIAEVFQPRENAPLAILAVHLWKRAAAYFDLHICWVKGHSGNIGNEKADFWAKRGADRRFHTAHWRRPCPAHDWGAEEYRKRFFNPQPRLAACSRQGTPSISALTAAISAGAAVAGHAPRRGRRRPPQGGPELLHLKRLEQLRAQESDLRARHLLGPAVAEAKRALRGRCDTVHLERLRARGRADRPYRSGKPVRELKTDDGLSANTARARCELTRAFYANLFADPTSDQALPAWVHSQWTAERQQAEGLQDDALEQILAAFRLRLCNHVSEYFDQVPGAWLEMAEAAARGRRIAIADWRSRLSNYRRDCEMRNVAMHLPTKTWAGVMLLMVMVGLSLGMALLELTRGQRRSGVCEGAGPRKAFAVEALEQVLKKHGIQAELLAPIVKEEEDYDASKLRVAADILHRAAELCGIATSIGRLGGAGVASVAETEDLWGDVFWVHLGWASGADAGLGSYHGRWSEAEITEAGGASGGVAALTSTDAAAAEAPFLYQAQLPEGRFVAAHLHRGAAKGIIAMGAYMHDAEGPGEGNIALAHGICRHLGPLNRAGMDWIVLGGWNVEPHCWGDPRLSQVRGQLIFNDGPTCAKSAAGTVYDYALVARNLLPWMGPPALQEDTATPAHYPVLFPLLVNDCSTWRRALVEPLGFSATPPAGCAHYPNGHARRGPSPQVVVVDEPAKLTQAWGFAVTASEKEFAARRHLRGANDRTHIGRGGSAQSKWEKFQRRPPRKRNYTDKTTHCWQVAARWATHPRNAQGHLTGYCKDLSASRALCPISHQQRGHLIKAVKEVLKELPDDVQRFSLAGVGALASDESDEVADRILQEPEGKTKAGIHGRHMAWKLRADQAFLRGHVGWLQSINYVTYGAHSQGDQVGKRTVASKRFKLLHKRLKRVHAFKRTVGLKHPRAEALWLGLRTDGPWWLSSQSGAWWTALSGPNIGAAERYGALQALEYFPNLSRTITDLAGPAVEGIRPDAHDIGAGARHARIWRLIQGKVRALVHLGNISWGARKVCLPTRLQSMQANVFFGTEGGLTFNPVREPAVQTALDGADQILSDGYVQPVHMVDFTEEPHIQAKRTEICQPQQQEAISEAPPAGAPGPTAPPQGGADFESLAPHVGELAQTATRLIGLEGRVAAALESLASAGRVEDFEPRMQEVSQQLEAIVPRVEELSRRTESLGELQAIAPRVSELAQSVARLTGAGGVEARLADAREAIDAQRGLAPRVAELARNLANVASCGPRAAELLRRLE
ncbi:unnamed protein product, partial [Prorocentrum cordatum]